MAYKIFQVPSYGCPDTEQALNNFLGKHRILCVTREFVNAGSNSFWSFCIDYLEQGFVEKGNVSGRRRSKVDYRELLDPDEFALFARLRDLRKELAQVEAVPVYAIFTNLQLAQIVQNRVIDKAALRAISGLGDARIEKYGQHVVELTSDHWKKLHEESGPTI